jgi:hypothetical protein
MQSSRATSDQVAPAGSSPAEGLAVSDSSCLSIGPFRSLNEVANVAATLREDGLTPRQRVEAGEVWVGYWVSWRGADTREKAEAAVSMLAERGITDTYILPGSEPPHVVSLGVFTDRRRAERRRDEVALLDLDATIADRRQPGSVYWIDVDRAQEAIDLATLQNEPGRIVRIESRPCPGAAPGATLGQADEAAPASDEPSAGLAESEPGDDLAPLE